MKYKVLPSTVERTKRTKNIYGAINMHANEFQSLVETFCRFKSQAKVFVTSSIAVCRYLQVEICRWNGESGLSGFFNQPAPFTHEIWKWKPWHAWIYFGNTCVQKSDKSMKVIGNNLWMPALFKESQKWQQDIEQVQFWGMLNVRLVPYNIIIFFPQPFLLVRCHWPWKPLPGVKDRDMVQEPWEAKVWPKKTCVSPSVSCVYFLWPVLLACSGAWCNSLPPLTKLAIVFKT